MLELPLLILAVIVAIPIGIVCLEYVAAASYRKRELTDGPRRNISVLIPAHNEQDAILQTIESVQSQLQSGDTLLVVADNCDDQTAQVARECGAEVLERFDAENRGKGFALDAGLRHLSKQQTHGAAVFMIDADCVLDDGAVRHLVLTALETGRPTQGTYLMHRPEDSGAAAVVSELAFTLKNHARALGDEVLGWPCVLRGSGMAFPWELLRDRNVASDHIVEDVKIGLELTDDGKPPMFCPEAFIRSQLPTTQSASTTQRTRWEHGYMAMAAQSPRLFLQGLTRGSWKLLGTAAILSIPPLSMHFAGWFLCFVVATVCWLAGYSTFLPATLFALMGVAFVGCMLLAWYRFASHDIPFRSLLSIPVYVLRKLPIYLRFFTGREKKWIRTSRT